MSLFDDLSNSFIDVFTSPGKANFGDYATVVGSLGGATAAGFGVAGLAGVGPWAAAPVAEGGLLPAGEGVLLAPADLAQGDFLAANAEPAFAGVASGGTGAAIPIIPGTGAAAPAAASSGGFWSGLGSIISGIGSTAFSYATIMAQKTGLKIPGASGSSVGPSSGPQIGISLPATKSAAPAAAQQASAAGSPLTMILLVGAGIGIFMLFNGKKR